MGIPPDFTQDADSSTPRRPVEEPNRYQRERKPGRAAIPPPPTWQGGFDAWEEIMSAQDRRRIRLDCEKEEEQRREMREHGAPVKPKYITQDLRDSMTEEQTSHEFELATSPYDADGKPKVASSKRKGGRVKQITSTTHIRQHCFS